MGRPNGPTKEKPVASAPLPVPAPNRSNEPPQTDYSRIVDPQPRRHVPRLIGAPSETESCSPLAERIR